MDSSDSFKSDYSQVANDAYSTIITVYIIIAVILVVLTVGGCIIVCICGRPKTTPGRVHGPLGTNQVQGIIPTLPPLANTVAPGTFPTAFQQYQNLCSQHEANSEVSGSPPPCYDESVKTGFVNPMYH